MGGILRGGEELGTDKQTRDGKELATSTAATYGTAKLNACAGQKQAGSPCLACTDGTRWLCFPLVGHVRRLWSWVLSASGRPSVHWKRLVTAIVPSALAGRGTTEGGRGGRACELRTATFETAMDLTVWGTNLKHTTHEARSHRSSLLAV